MEYVKPILLCCYPVLSLCFSGAVFSIALHSSSQRIRLYLLPLFLASSVYSFNSSKYFWFIPSLVSLWSLGVSLNILHIISVLYIERWPVPSSSRQHSPTHEAASKGWWNLDFHATYKLWGNPQLLSETTHLPSEVHTYSVFFFLRLIKLPIYYYLQLYVIPSIFSETIVEIYHDDVGPIQQTLFRRLGEVTAREVVIRGYTAVFWIVESVLFLDGANAILASFFVLVGLDHPDDWPALFGSLRSATSLRKFWSRFWHRLAVRPYSNYGKVIAHRMKFRPDSFAFKTIVAFVVFALSGASHSAVSWNLGQREWHLDFWWFILNFVGCSIEIFLSSVLRSFAKSMKYSRELKMIEDSWFGNFVGYAWVFGFFFWSTPKWKYPSLYRKAIIKERWSVLQSTFSIVDG